jgi:hypothetical protein
VRSIRKLGLGEKRNLSILDHDGGSQLLDHVQFPSIRGRSIRPNSKVNSENSNRARVEWVSLDLSLT